MISLNGLVVLSILVIAVGKHARALRWFMYFIVAVITLAQVGVVLYDMFTLPQPV